VTRPLLAGIGRWCRIACNTWRSELDRNHAPSPACNVQPGPGHLASCTTECEEHRGEPLDGCGRCRADGPRGRPWGGKKKDVEVVSDLLRLGSPPRQWGPGRPIRRVPVAELRGGGGLKRPPLAAGVVPTGRATPSTSKPCPSFAAAPQGNERLCPPDCPLELRALQDGKKNSHCRVTRRHPGLPAMDVMDSPSNARRAVKLSIPTIASACCGAAGC